MLHHQRTLLLPQDSRQRSPAILEKPSLPLQGHLRLRNQPSNLRVLPAMLHFSPHQHGPRGREDHRRSIEKALVISPGTHLLVVARLLPHHITALLPVLVVAFRATTPIDRHHSAETAPQLPTPTPSASQTISPIYQPSSPVENHYLLASILPLRSVSHSSKQIRKNSSSKSPRSSGLSGLA